MSKINLRNQARELLGLELREIKGGTDPITYDCTSCETCFSSCSPGCNKKSSTQ